MASDARSHAVRDMSGERLLNSNSSTTGVLSMHGSRLVAIMAVLLTTSIVGCRTSPLATDNLPAQKPRSPAAKPPVVVHPAKPKPTISAPPTVVPESPGETIVPEASEPEESADLPLPEGYSCCNLHYEDDWISDSNFLTLPMIPVGTPIKVLKFGRNRAYVKLGDKLMRIGLDYGRQQLTLQQWIDRVVVPEDPHEKIAGFPAPIQAAIKAGRIVLGMTREQVIMAVGYPVSSENPSLGELVWKMRASMYGTYQLKWDASGKLAKIVADRSTRELIVIQPSE
jgi:hypothetical protein